MTARNLVIVAVVCAAAEAGTLRATWSSDEVTAGEVMRGRFEEDAPGGGVHLALSDDIADHFFPELGRDADGDLTVPP